jgi:hypothetical protein
METIPVDVPEPMFREFNSRERDRASADLIRDAIMAYRKRWAARRGAVRETWVGRSDGETG